MKPTASHSSKSPTIDYRQSLLETFCINERANQLLLGNLHEDAWPAAPPSGKGRSIGSIAAHMHNVRLMWLGVADKSTKLPAKLDPDKASCKQEQASLEASAEAILALLQKAVDDPAGKVSHFKPNVVAFVGYLIAHDSHHRGQISMLARQVGHPLPAKIGFGLWEWGAMWRDCGFGK